MLKSDRLLLDCLRVTGREDGERLREITFGEWEEISVRAVRHLVMPQLYLCLIGAGLEREVPEKIFERMQQLYFRNLAASVRRNHALSRCLKVLDEAGIPVVVLKGACLGELIYGNIGARIISDADLLVRNRDLGAAQRCLLAAGLYPAAADLNIDLHWYLDTDYPIDMASVWARSRSARIAQQNALVLSVEDLLLHLCLHLASHHQFRRIGIRTLCDIREIVSRYGEEIDWRTVSGTASQWGMGKAMQLTLLMARSLLKVPIPCELMSGGMAGENHEQVLARALMNFFEDEAEPRSLVLSPFFWGIWTSKSVASKVRNLRNVLMPPPEFISQKYPVSRGSFKNYVYYLVRFMSHALVYLSATVRLLIRERRMRAVFKKEQRNLSIRGWLLECPDGKGPTGPAVVRGC